MKKSLVILVFLSLFSGAVSAQSDIQQAVSPKVFYVGDTAEVRYSFKSGVDFFSDLDKSIFERQINISRMPFAIENDDFSLVSASLIRSKVDYTVVLTIIPWKSGKLIIPAIDLYSVVYEENKVPFVIKIQPVEVGSLLDKDSDIALLPPEGPLLVPGTTYFIWGFLILTLIVLIVIIRVILKWSVIAVKINNIKMAVGYAKNARTALKKLSKLLKKSDAEDEVFAGNFQKILRKYLSYRFGENFETVPSSSIAVVFNEITQGVVSDFYLDQIEKLSMLFFRTDYIRYASGSIDSRRVPKKDYETRFQEGERENLVQSAGEIIRNFENGGEEK